MLFDKAKDEIARELAERAEVVWGRERAAAQKAQIEDTAAWLASIGKHSFGLDGDEPDFLVEPPQMEQQ